MARCLVLLATAILVLCVVSRVEGKPDAVDRLGIVGITTSSKVFTLRGKNTSGGTTNLQYMVSPPEKPELFSVHMYDATAANNIGNEVTSSYEVVPNEGTYANIVIVTKGVPGESEVLFKVKDLGTNEESDPGVFTVKVDRPPTAQPYAATVLENTHTTLTLNDVSDPDGDQIVVKVTPPANMAKIYDTIDGTTPFPDTPIMSPNTFVFNAQHKVIFVPDQDTIGVVVFHYAANDGTMDSDLEDVVITINGRPTVKDINKKSARDTSVVLTLEGTDPDGSTLTYYVDPLTPAENGNIYQYVGDGAQGAQISGPMTEVTDGHGRVVFVPTEGKTGRSSFKYYASDGSTDPSGADIGRSEAGTVNMDVDIPPKGNPIPNQETKVGVPVTLELTGGDDDNADADLIFKASPPNEHGTLHQYSTTAANNVGTKITEAGTVVPSVGGKRRVVFQPLPNGDFGESTFQWWINDGIMDSTPLPTKVKVNARPVALGGIETDLAINVPGSVTLGGTDGNMDPLTFVISALPQKNLGTLFQVKPDGSQGDAITAAGTTITDSRKRVIYSPGSQTGEDWFFYKADDGFEQSEATKVTIEINALSAQSASYVSDEGKDYVVTLVGSAGAGVPDTELEYFIADPNMQYGDIYEFDASQPGNKGAEITASNSLVTDPSRRVVFSPHGNAHGSSAFTWYVRRHNLDSGMGTITVRINYKPTASGQTIVLQRGKTAVVTLQGDDGDKDPLTFYVNKPTSDKGFVCQYTAAETCSAASAITTKTLVTDRYRRVVFYSAPDADGNISFLFNTNDGHEDSEDAEVIMNINSRPKVEYVFKRSIKNADVVIELKGTDPDGDIITYSVDMPKPNGLLFRGNENSGVVSKGSQITHDGTNIGTNSFVVFEPSDDQAGEVSFDYTVTDSRGLSAFHTNVTIYINTKPQAFEQRVITTEEHAIAVTLAATDVDHDKLRFFVSPPTDGKVYQADATGRLGSIIQTIDTEVSNRNHMVYYKPSTGFTGAASFQFKVKDEIQYSTPADIFVKVNNRPTAKDQTVVTTKDQSKAIWLKGNDKDPEDKPKLVYKVSPPATKGKLYACSTSDGPTSPDDPTPDEFGAQITATNTALPDHINCVIFKGIGETGVTTFEFRVTDDIQDSLPATVKMSISNRPVAKDLTFNINKNSATLVSLECTDEDDVTLDYDIDQAPMQGWLQDLNSTLTSNTRVWDPQHRLLYIVGCSGGGPDVFTYVCKDAVSTSIPGTVTMNIANAAPEAIGQQFYSTGSASRTLTLEGADADGDHLTFYVNPTDPRKGNLYQSNPDGSAGAEITEDDTRVTDIESRVVFIPQPAYRGEVDIPFQAFDGGERSNTATTQVHVLDTVGCTFGETMATLLWPIAFTTLVVVIIGILLFKFFNLKRFFLEGNSDYSDEEQQRQMMGQHEMEEIQPQRWTHHDTSRPYGY